MVLEIEFLPKHNNKITWRKNYKYQSYNDCIGKLLDDNNIKIPFRRRKFDHFLWYPNRQNG